MSDSTTLVERLLAQKEVHSSYSGTGKVALVRGDFTDPLCREAADAIEQLHAAIAEQAREIEALRRWKSTHAPRIEALQGLKDHAQHEAALGVEARATLESERAANAILTAEVEALLDLLRRVADETNPYSILCRAIGAAKGAT